MMQLFIHFFCQVFESRKVAQVSGFLLDIAPQIFDGVEIGGITGKLVNCDAVGVFGKKLTQRFGSMIARPVLNDNQVSFHSRQHLNQKSNIAF